MPLLFKIANEFKKNEAIKGWYRIIRAWSIAAIYNISPIILAKLRYKVIRGRWPDLKDPRTFDEKLLWLMLYWRHPLKSLCGDKYTMRSYVKELGLEHILPKLLGVYRHSSEIDFNSLPQRFVLKCTHGCGFNIICKNKSYLDIEETKRKLDSWMKSDFSKVYGEIHYAGMKPRIICEYYLDELDSELPCDYKVYCFSGRAHCTMACTDRDLEGHRAKYDLYDREWENKLPYSQESLLADRNIQKPASYEEMIKVAEILSQPFPFVRVDFYSINGKAVLGEMTFTPADCIDTGYTDIAQATMGGLINLPEKRLE